MGLLKKRGEGMDNRMRVKTIKGLAILALITAIISGCCLDSESYVPMITFGISITYLLLVCLANTRD